MTRRIPAILAALILPALPATAQEAMSGTEFYAYVGGHTLTYARGGRILGVEQYLPGRKVIWRRAEGECEEGVWFEAAGRICFDYGESGAQQCWQFVNKGGRLGARADGDPQGAWLYEARRSSEPMQCPAPYLGT